MVFGGLFGFPCGFNPPKANKVVGRMKIWGSDHSKALFCAGKISGRSWSVMRYTYQVTIPLYSKFCGNGSMMRTYDVV